MKTFISLFIHDDYYFRAAMMEPGVRYLPGPLQLPPQPHVTLEAAVDLTKKSESWRDSEPRELEADRTEDDGSDSDTPLDMSVTATRLSSSPVFPGFQRMDREVSPARSDRSDTGLLMRPFLYSPGAHHRDRSADRSDLDKGCFEEANILRVKCSNDGIFSDEYNRDRLQRSDISGFEHGEVSDGPIACPLCTKTFTLWSHYEAHKKCHQKLKQRQYPCQTCGKVS